MEAAAGKITLDGKDISQLGLKTLRSALTIIPQATTTRINVVNKNKNVIRSEHLM